MDTLMLLFDWILAASLRASLLIVVVLLIQMMLRHRVPARWRYALWVPVLIVLLMPVFPESAWSVSSITYKVSAPLLGPVVEITRRVDGPASLPPAMISAAPTPVPWQKIMRLTWLAGVAGMLLSGIVSLVLTLWRFHRRRLPVQESLQREITAVAREIGLRGIPRVWMAQVIRSPAVTGLLRPTLLLPAGFEQALTAPEIRHVIKHELMHIKRGDLQMNVLLCLLLALHWFNPLLWIAFFKARLDREAACDAQVLERETVEQRVAYGHTLLKVEAAFSHHGFSLAFVGIFQRGSALRARIQSLASFPSQHPLMKIAVTLSIVLLTFLGITKATSPDPKLPKIYITSKFIEITEKEPGPSDHAPLPAPLDAATKKPGFIATLSDPEFQVLIRSLNQKKGVDLMSAPSLTARSGQPAKVEVVREFVYHDEAGKPVTVYPGVTLAVIPLVTAENQIELDLSPQVLEFEGFEGLEEDGEAIVSRKVMHTDGTTTESANDVGKGEVRESKFDARGVLLSKRTVPSSKSRADAYAKPIFTKRTGTASATIGSGQTMVLELHGRMDAQTVQELDAQDRVISSKIDLFHRRLFVFVTATLLDPVTGKRLDR
jgi:beta-lactamase regulating signal transducer with metallopeptidase domain